MLIRGTCLTNIPCHNEAQKKGRESVRYHSIRLLIEAVCHQGTWYTPDMYGSRPEGINKVKPILEISYENEVPHEGEYDLIRDLQPKARYELTVSNEECFFTRKNHLSNTDQRGVMSLFVKCFGNAANISFVQEIGEAKLPAGTSIVNIPSAEVITKLIWINDEVAAPALSTL